MRRADVTEQEQRLSDDKVRAEITHLNAMTAKLLKETRWYEAVILTAFLAAGAALGKMIL
ncbi:MAG: hypothetical protein GW905_12980 [Rhodobacterales bacterium]|nr:hypothetical protein [Rhodobacterales bacterium]